jgi:DNA-binding PucR family transcriptional regulator
VPVLADVVKNPALRLRVLVDGRLDTPVRWVATSELDDPTPFLEGGEIVLTTGLAATAWDDPAWSGYVERLGRAGAVAVGFGIGLTHVDVPASLVAAARRIGLALFAVPRAVPFVAVSRTIARLVQQEEQRALQSALAVQQQLTRAAVATDGATAILDRLARIVRGDAVVCDRDATTLLRARPRDDARDPLPARLAELIDRLRPRGMRASHTDAGPRGGTVIQPLGLSGNPHAYLVVTATASWDAAAQTAIAAAAALLSLDFERRAEALATAREVRSAGLHLLLSGRAESGQTLLALRAAAVASLDGEQFHVLRTHCADDAHALNALERWAAEQPTGRLVASSSGGGPPVAVLREGTDVAGAVAALGPGGRAGLGEARALVDLAAADATARAALLRASAQRPVTRWDDVVDEGPPALLSGPAADEFARAVLGPLATPSTENAALLTTLDAFHRHHGQMTVIAGELRVHRNTVTRRLRRVEELTGRSPSTPRGRFELWMAVEVLRSGEAAR